MGCHVTYLGRIAYLNHITRPKSRTDLTQVTKYSLSFESPKDLAVLLSMDPTDPITVGGKTMDYDRFQTEILGNTHNLYTSRDGRMLDEVQARIETPTPPPAPSNPPQE